LVKLREGKQASICEYRKIEGFEYKLVGDVNGLPLYYNPKEGYMINICDGNFSEPTIKQLKEINNNYEFLEGKINKFTEEYNHLKYKIKYNRQ